MSATDSPRNRWLLASGWLIFVVVNVCLMFLLPSEETISYHLIWASFASLFGVFTWSNPVTWLTFSSITVLTAVPLAVHVSTRITGWEECSEFILTGVLVAMLIWHVKRHRIAQDRLSQLRETERIRAHHRDVAARFGSHEVRTRLTIAHGFAELLRDASVDERQRADAEVVLAELEKATALATRLLELVRFETAPSVTTVNLGNLIEAVLRRWEATVDRDWSSRIAIEAISADPERLETALDCLIENAVKFTNPADSIAINVLANRGGVGITVIDSGAGIPAEDLGRITEIFQTGAKPDARAGNGLGLAIVSAVVTARGGALEISSIEGAGTSVTMWLPVSNLVLIPQLVPVEVSA